MSDAFATRLPRKAEYVPDRAIRTDNTPGVSLVYGIQAGFPCVSISAGRPLGRPFSLSGQGNMGGGNRSNRGSTSFPESLDVQVGAR